MDCPNCGKDNPFNTEICGHCGFAIKEDLNRKYDYYWQGKRLLEEKEYHKALDCFMKTVEFGLSISLVEIGDIYYYGKGVDIDYCEAVKWYQKGVEEWTSDADIRLAMMYQYGRGVDRDLTRAIELYGEAVEYDNAEAAENLGLLYETAPEGIKSYNLAMQYYEKAAELDSENPTIYGKIGKAYMKGIGRPVNYDKASHFFKKAIEHECTDGEVYFNLAELYQHGRGGDKNEYIAEKYYQKAIELGYAQAKVPLEQLLQKMHKDREEGKAALARLQAMVAEHEANCSNTQEEWQNRLTRTCPRCGRKSGQPINGFEKKASIAFWGFASSKWGKSYKCSACGYAW